MIPGLVKLIEYRVSSANVWYNRVFSLRRIKISFALLSMSTDELISTLKIITFLPMLPSRKEWYPRESNPIQQLICKCLSRSTFLVNLTLPKKEPPKVKSVSKFRGHESNS